MRWVRVVLSVAAAPRRERLYHWGWCSCFAVLPYLVDGGSSSGSCRAGSHSQWWF